MWKSNIAVYDLGELYLYLIATCVFGSNPVPVSYLDYVVDAMCYCTLSLFVWQQDCVTNQIDYVHDVSTSEMVPRKQLGVVVHFKGCDLSINTRCLRNPHLAMLFNRCFCRNTAILKYFRGYSI